MNRRDFLARLMQAAAAAPVAYSFIGTGIWVPPTKVLNVTHMGGWTLENMIRHNLDVRGMWTELTFVR